MTTNNQRYTRPQAAQRIGVSLSWLDKARAKGVGPRFLQVGGRVLYQESAIVEFEQKNLRG